MDLIQILEQKWSVVQAEPVLSILLILVGGIAAWLLRRSIAQGKINRLKGQLDDLQDQLKAGADRKVLVEERLSAVVRYENMLKTQVAALQQQFQVVDDQVMRQGHVPALIGATGSTASTITNIVLTADALTGSLDVLRLGFRGHNGSCITKTDKPEGTSFPSNTLIQATDNSLR
jgi:hypothetical protein